MSGSHLAHYGVKGMKWGQRQDKGHEGQTASTKKIARLDKKFDKSAGSVRTHVAIYNGAAKKMNDVEINRINNKPEYKDVDLTNPKNSKLNDKYMKEYADSFSLALAESAKSLGTNASGTKEYAVSVSDSGGLYISSSKVMHAALPNDVVELYIRRNDKGHILRLGLPEGSDLSELLHSGLSDAELVHYGVKGMKWGVRASQKTTGVSRTQGAQLDRNSRRRAKIESMLGNNRDAKGAAQDFVKSGVIGLVGGKNAKTDKHRKILETSLKNLDDQDDRIRSGKTNAKDLLDAYASVSVLDLYVSRTPSD